ncbi:MULTISPECIES: hypothetical protein [Bacillus]|uniref:hypothetical protein n=1 Tax=Bacillus TaxID=1386 RepID=UPI000BB8C3F6|nr:MULTISPECIES: hypothetical protein [Bacillus]
MELLQKELIFYTLFLGVGFYIVFHCILLIGQKGVTTASFTSRMMAYSFSGILIVWVTFYTSNTPYTIHDYIFLLIPFVIPFFFIVYKDSKSYEVKVIQYNYKQVFHILESTLSKNNYTFKQTDESEPGIFREKYKTLMELENGRITVSWVDKKQPTFIIIFQHFKDKDLRNEMISIFREELQVGSYLRLIGFDLLIGILCIIYSTYHLLG